MTATAPPAHDRPVSRDRDDRWRIRPGGATLAAVGIGAVALEAGIRHPPGVLSFAAVAAVAGACLVGGWVRDSAATVLLGAALVPAGFLVVRTSAWLVPLDVAATVVLLFGAAMVRPEPDRVGRAFGRLFRPRSALEPVAASGALLVRSGRVVVSGRAAPGLRRVGTGLLLGLPVAGALVALLAASDALFRTWVTVPIDPSAMAGHGIIIGLGVAAMGALAAHGAWLPVSTTRPARALLGTTEATVVLAAIAVVHAGFVVAQIVAVTGGAAYVERTTGLTYAEYARSGFFQLLAAALVTLAALIGVARHRQAPGRSGARALLLLEETIVVLTLVAVATAIRRLVLYEAAFGLTMLRLYTIVFAGFIGFVFVIVGLARAGRCRHPLTTVLAGTFSLLLVMNLIDPERVVARRNIDRFGGTAQLDITYLTTALGDDALPVVLTDPGAAAVVCADAPHIDDRAVTFNLARHRAAVAIDRVCG